MEPHPSQFVERLVDLFVRLRPALKQTATIWLNIGDSYFSSPGKGAQGPQAKNQKANYGRGSMPPIQEDAWVRPKQLMGMPWRVAIAMQDAGFLLRNDNIWAKTNVLPDSSQDKQCPSHEHVFLFSLGPRYYYDLLLEPAVTGNNGSHYHTGKTATHQQGRASKRPRKEPTTRHVRDVWIGPTEGCSEAHFAVMPSWIADRCLRAGCPTQVCAECGGPLERIVQRGNSEHHCRPGCGCGQGEKRGDRKGYGGFRNTAVATDEFAPTCPCDAGTEPGRCLDPFLGAGTTLAVAKELGLRGVGFELSDVYADMAARRIDAWGRDKHSIVAEAAGQLTLGGLVEQ